MVNQVEDKELREKIAGAFNDFWDGMTLQVQPKKEKISADWGFYYCLGGFVTGLIAGYIVFKR